MPTMTVANGYGGEDQVQALQLTDNTLICVFGSGTMIEIIDDATIIINIKNIIKDGNIGMVAMIVGIMKTNYIY